MEDMIFILSGILELMHLVISLNGKHKDIL